MWRGGLTTFAEYLLPLGSTMTQFNFLLPDPSSQRLTWTDNMKRLPHPLVSSQKGGAHQQKPGGKKKREADHFRPVQGTPSHRALQASRFRCFLSLLLLQDPDFCILAWSFPISFPYFGNSFLFYNHSQITELEAAMVSCAGLSPTSTP